jgi:hypothetical protein
MEEGAAGKVMGLSLSINIFATSLLLLAFFPMALMMTMFLVSLGTDKLFDLEGGGLASLQRLLLLLTFIPLLACLIITVGSRVYLDSKTKHKKKERSDRQRSYMFLWAGVLSAFTASVLVLTSITGELEHFEGWALWIIFLIGMMLVSIGYGLASIHLSQFDGETWVGRMRGLARLPPMLLLLGFPAVSMLAVLDGFPFISVLLVFCNGVLMTSIAVTIIVNGRTMYAIRRHGARPV